MYDFWYVPEGKMVEYNIYKLTNKGWELLARKKEIRDNDLYSYVLPYLSDAIIPDGWR